MNHSLAFVFALLLVYVVSRSLKGLDSRHSWLAPIVFKKIIFSEHLHRIYILNRNVGLVWLELVSAWPALLGGQAHWTVGLIATIIAISTIIAADTGAFLGGRVCFYSLVDSFILGSFFSIQTQVLEIVASFADSSYSSCSIRIHARQRYWES